MLVAKAPASFPSNCKRSPHVVYPHLLDYNHLIVSLFAYPNSQWLKFPYPKKKEKKSG